MKTKIANNWPAIRQIAYGIGAIALGGSWLAGWITSDQLDAGLDQIEQLLGAAALLMAGLYVDRRKPSPDLAPTYELSIDPKSATAVIERVRAEAATRLDDVPMPDGVRAELERRLRG